MSHATTDQQDTGVTMFEVGVLVISWVAEVPWTIQNRPGQIYGAEIVECRTPHGTLLRDAVGSALMGVVVHAPGGALSVVRGVESNASMSLHVGSRLGLLLEPIKP